MDSDVVADLQLNNLTALHVSPEESAEVEKKIPLVPLNNSTSQVPSPKDAGVISYVEKYVCKRKEKLGVIRTVLIVGNMLESNFMSKMLQDISQDSGGNYTYHHKNKTTVQFFCERHSKPRGKKKGPLHTRANNCQAYVSFMFHNINGTNVAIVRKYINHAGHDPAAEAEKRVSAVDPALQAYIECLLSQGKKPMEIMVLCYNWSRARLHTNFNNRAFFPTPQDIKYLSQKYRDSKRLHKEDSASTRHLCTVILKDSIVLYQDMMNEQPLIVVYQNQRQRERMAKLGQGVVFMDASYKGLTAYGYAIYCIYACNQHDRGTPLAYIITSSDTSATLTKCLLAIKDYASENGIVFEPRAFMVDKDCKEICAIRNAFPKSSVLLCWFHVLQAVHRWLSKRESCVAGDENLDNRKVIIQCMRHLKYTSTKQEFESQANNVCTELKEFKEVVTYLQRNWFGIADMWANFGRKFYHKDQETNNLVERFFLSVKYHFLGGYGNQRVDDLLLLLDGDVSTYHDYMEELHKVDRLKIPKQQMGSHGKLAADRMLLNGWAQKIVWLDDSRCQVQSETSAAKKWTVNIVKLTCDCPSSARKGMCKHVHVSLNIAAMRGIKVEEQRMNIGQDLFDRQQFIEEDSHILVFDNDGDVNMINKLNMKCTCIAASHDNNCVCLHVASKLVGEKSSPLRNGIDGAVSYEHTTTKQETTTCTKLLAKQHLQEIIDWFDSDHFQEKFNKEDIIMDIEHLHKKVFLNKFKRITRKKKIEPNCSYRQSIIKAKRIKLASEHAYASVGSKGKKVTTTFKRSRRALTPGRKLFS